YNSSCCIILDQIAKFVLHLWLDFKRQIGNSTVCSVYGDRCRFTGFYKQFYRNGYEIPVLFCYSQICPCLFWCFYLHWCTGVSISLKLALHMVEFKMAVEIHDEKKVSPISMDWYYIGVRRINAIIPLFGKYKLIHLTVIIRS